MPRAVKLTPDSGISKLNCSIVIAPALCSDTVEDSVKMVHLQELYGEVNTVYANVCIFYNRHQEVLFTRPQSMDNMRKSKSIFPVDVRLTLKIRLSIIHLKCRLLFDKVVA